VEPIFKVCLAEYKHVSYLKIGSMLSVASTSYINRRKS